MLPYVYIYIYITVQVSMGSCDTTTADSSAPGMGFKASEPGVKAWGGGRYGKMLHAYGPICGAD